MYVPVKVKKCLQYYTVYIHFNIGQEINSKYNAFNNNTTLPYIKHFWDWIWIRKVKFIIDLTGRECQRVTSGR